VLPPLVEKALASGLGGGSDVRGRLLHVLAGQRGRARVAQVGWSLDAAWVVAGLAPGVPFILVESDDRAAADAEAFFSEDREVRVLQGAWGDLLPAEAPFDLLVAPAATGDRIVELLAPGGTLVTLRPAPEHPRLATVELRVSPHEAVIVGTLQPR